MKKNLSREEREGDEESLMPKISKRLCHSLFGDFPWDVNTLGGLHKFGFWNIHITSHLDKVLIKYSL